MARSIIYHTKLYQMVDKSLDIRNGLVHITIRNLCFYDKIIDQIDTLDLIIKKFPDDQAGIIDPDTTFMITDALGGGKEIIISGYIDVCKESVSSHNSILA